MVRAAEAVRTVRNAHPFAIKAIGWAIPERQF